MITVTIEGITFWGESVRTLNFQEIDQISISRDSLLHYLRHFSQLPRGWRERVVRDEWISEEELNSLMTLPGSKWNPRSSIRTPEDILDVCQELLRRKIKKDPNSALWLTRFQGETCVVQYDVDPEEREHLFQLEDFESIGTEGVIPIDDSLKPFIRIEQRIQSRSMVVDVNIIDYDPPQTNSIVMGLRRTKNGSVKIRTVHPGRITPSIPYVGQYPEEQGYSAQYWGDHAFVREKYK
ncbi:MAG: hypothetical protein Q7S63_00505 [bacterium]|nr:hypothetical protein [bacterium]